jgi:membrane protein implicated in regulation of membrane protease activity
MQSRGSKIVSIAIGAALSLSLMTVTLLIAGVQFLILGVLGEYVGRSFMSANGKPQGVVREILPARDEGRTP